MRNGGAGGWNTALGALVKTGRCCLDFGVVRLMGSCTWKVSRITIRLQRDSGLGALILFPKPPIFWKVVKKMILGGRSECQATQSHSVGWGHHSGVQAWPLPRSLSPGVFHVTELDTHTLAECPLDLGPQPVSEWHAFSLSSATSFLSGSLIQLPLSNGSHLPAPDGRTEAL